MTRTRPTVCSFHLATGSESEQKLAATVAELQSRFGPRVAFVDRDVTDETAQDHADECGAPAVGLAVVDPVTGRAWPFGPRGTDHAAAKLAELLSAG